MFHCHPCIFPCVWINLWSQEEVRRWRKSEVLSNLAPKLHVLVPKLAFWGDFTTVRYHFSARKLMSTFKPPKNAVWRPKTTFFCKDAFKKGMFSRRVSLAAWFLFLEPFPAWFLAKSAGRLIWLITLINLFDDVY